MDADVPPHANEDFAQVLAELRDHYDVTDSEIARRVGISPAAVHNWTHRKAIPRSAAIKQLSEAFPAFPQARLAAAAGRTAPGPLTPDREARVLELFRQLTTEQQRLAEIQLKAWRDNNQT